jgi:hypothetical protein
MEQWFAAAGKERNWHSHPDPGPQIPGYSKHSSAYNKELGGFHLLCFTTPAGVFDHVVLRSYRLHVIFLKNKLQ